MEERAGVVAGLIVFVEQVLPPSGKSSGGGNLT